MCSWSKGDVLEFIQTYRSLPCLWNVHSKEYSNKFLKENAYKRLVEQVREFDDNASRDMVLKKINNLRTTFRKELKKVEMSRSTASGIEDEYVPSLWYYPHLLFLVDEGQGGEGEAFCLDASCLEAVEGHVSLTTPTHYSQQDYDSTTGSTICGDPSDLTNHRHSGSLGHSGQHSASNGHGLGTNGHGADSDSNSGLPLPLQGDPSIDSAHRARLSPGFANTLGLGVASPAASLSRKRAYNHNYNYSNYEFGPTVPALVKRRRGVQPGAPVAALEEDQDPLVLPPPVEDEHEAFGRSLSHRLRALSQLQRLHAEVLISRVMYEAGLGNLCRQSHLVVGKEEAGGEGQS